MNPILEVKNLTVSAERGILLEKIGFHVEKGEIFALVGESGSGKSLTSLSIMRLLPPTLHVVSGDVILQGESLFALPEYKMREIRGRRIAMIFQEPMSALNPVMRIGEQVAEAVRLHLHLSATAAKERVISLFEEVALPEPRIRYNWYPHQLSGGQKQRVMIAMALACEPDLLIADEPTTALDVTVQAQVLALLKALQKKRTFSILFITHDLAVVSHIADRVAVMRKGQIVETASSADFFSSPKHPYSRQLLRDASAMESKASYPSQNNTLLEIRDLKVHFPAKRRWFGRKGMSVRAVDGVNLTIAKGKTLALVGESGSGKSTLGRAVLSLVPITSGSIRFDGTEITSLKGRHRKIYRRKIQVVFQDPFASLDGRMRIGEIIAEGMESLGVGPKTKESRRAYIARLLEKVELEPDAMDRYPHAFSGGQRQRISIARALAVEPELIICDEPTSALDVTVRAQVLSLLKKIQKETGVSYLFITHDLSIVPFIADEVAVMQSGKIVEQGCVSDVMHHPQASYTQALLRAAVHLPDTIHKGKEV